MGFYTKWEKSFLDNLEESDYVTRFLLSDKESVKDLMYGDEQELQAAYEIISKVPIEDFFHVIELLPVLPEFTAADVPCFSTMENGASRLNELLMFSPDGLTFSEIGYQLMDSKTEAAQKKYGENQSKLAAVLSLVTLHRSKSVIVKPTAFGTFLTEYEYDEKKEVLKKLAMRNPCVMTILRRAFDGYVNYADVVYFLKPSTQRRRGTNVRYLVNFILKDSPRELTLSNIDWKVE